MLETDSKKISVKKGEIIQYRGTLNSKVYTVEKGLLRSYSIDKKGKEYIFMFASEGWKIADSKGPNEPCELYIDALEDSVVSVIEKTRDSLELMIETVVHCVSLMQDRVMALMSSSAIERYDHFIKTYPQITKRVSQKMIASYLGITPEALSKVKNQRVKEQDSQ
ncbi:MAG: Crp/Fnr family transcriptional regulator [Bacteroidota bacterium]